MLTIQGVYIGSRVVPYGSEGKSRTEIGIQIQVFNGFGQSVSSNAIVRVPAARGADVAKWDTFIGQHVSVSVFVQAFPSKSGAGYCFWLQNDASPLPLQA